jgi:hypothetical protein
MPRKSKGAKAVQSKEDALAEAKSLYTSPGAAAEVGRRAAGRAEHGVLFDDVLGKLTTPIETLLQSAARHDVVVVGASSKSVDKLGASLTSGLSDVHGESCRSARCSTSCCRSWSS